MVQCHAFFEKKEQRIEPEHDLKEFDQEDVPTVFLVDVCLFVRQDFRGDLVLFKVGYRQENI
ncbi:MAG: hypothetical protein WBG71_04960, partial [Leeuwenhoekiella sp.]